MTSPESEDDVRRVVEGDPGRWKEFPTASFVERYAENLTGVRWVLFYEGGRPDLIAYAEARDFTKELIIYHRTGGDAAIRGLLNEPSPDAR